MRSLPQQSPSLSRQALGEVVQKMTPASDGIPPPGCASRAVADAIRKGTGQRGTFVTRSGMSGEEACTSQMSTGSVGFHAVDDHCGQFCLSLGHENDGSASKQPTRWRNSRITGVAHPSPS